MRRFGLVVLLCLSGCMGWSVQTTPVLAGLDSLKPNAVRVVRSGGSITTLHYPRIVADSIAGYSGSYMPRSVFQSVPLADIKGWQRRELSAANTVGFGLLSLLAAGIVALGRAIKYSDP